MMMVAILTKRDDDNADDVVLPSGMGGDGDCFKHLQYTGFAVLRFMALQ